MRLRCFAALTAAAFVAGCGGDDPGAPAPMTTPDAGRPAPRACPPGPNVCACADDGPADFSRAEAGMASAMSTPDQQAALVRTNHWRTAAGLPPLDADERLEQAAVAHSRFMATNPSSCWPGAHNEVASCMGFTGTGPGQRITAAGYRPATAGEVINWESSPQRSIDGWIWTVYHRTPFQDPAFTQVGFGVVQSTVGATRRNNTMEFARPAGASPQALTDVSLFPPPGTANVPTFFQGNLEGPTPPVPQSTRRWPSGTVISLMFPTSNFSVETHRLYDGQCQEVVHSAFRAAGANVADAADDSNNRNPRFVFLYADARMRQNTRYTVEVRGALNGEPWSRVWAFTTSP